LKNTTIKLIKNNYDKKDSPLNKIQEIFTAWGISFNPSDAQVQIASDRIEICDTCENKRTSPIIHCGLCGCALRAKIYTPVDDACPAGKWPKIEEESTS
jgi:hypothetical protein